MKSSFERKWEAKNSKINQFSLDLYLELDLDNMEKGYQLKLNLFCVVDIRTCNVDDDKTRRFCKLNKYNGM